MKRLAAYLLAAASLFTACRKEAVQDHVSVLIPVTLESVSTKADGAAEADRLLVGVYRKDAAGKLTFQPESSHPSMQEALTVQQGRANCQLSLTAGENYLLVFWAQSRGNQDYTPDFEAGTMTMAGEALSNDNSRDAFYGTLETGPISGNNLSFKDIVLKRPFAQINVLPLEEDLQLAGKAGLGLSRSALYLEHVPNVLHLTSGAVSGDARISFSPAAVPAGLIASNLILAGDERLIDAELAVYAKKGGTEQQPATFRIPNVKVCRNYKTNLTGRVFTTGLSFDIRLEYGFDTPGYSGNIPTPPDEPGTPDNPDNPDNPDEPEVPDNPDNPDPPDEPELPSATGMVTTLPATDISFTEAVLRASYADNTGDIAEMGFFWGTSPGLLNQTLYADYSPSGSFDAVLSSLQPGTTYYYRAFIAEYDAAQGRYVDRLGAVLSFTTEKEAAVNTDPGYLGCFEMPDVSALLSGTSIYGTKADRDDRWYRYGTTNSRRQIVTHTYTLSGKQVRNYTVLYDGSKYAPVWTAHAMHRSMWPNNNAGRNDSWTEDPGISLTQQTGLNNASAVGYSRGHLVASNYRQSSVGQNKQTFYYSNQAPQWQNGFNDGTWSSLETDVTGHAPSGRDTLYVVTGVLYEGTVKTLPSREGLQVPIPSHFYKCLMKCSFNASGEMTAAKGCAYIFTNESHSGMPYSSGISSIDAIEQRAGFDFFARVPEALQKEAERTSSPLW